MDVAMIGKSTCYTEKNDAFTISFEMDHEGCASYPYTQFMGVELDKSESCICLLFTSATILVRGRKLRHIFQKVSDRNISDLWSGKCSGPYEGTEIDSITISRQSEEE